MNNIVKLLFEVNFLQRLKRSQRVQNPITIAAHSFRVAIIGYLLGSLGKGDTNKIIKMCLIHDLPETRTGDLDYVNRRYCQANEQKALIDQFKGLPIESEVIQLFTEFQEKKTLESKLAHDADILEEILTEKQQQDSGNQAAASWHKFNQQNLTNKISLKLYREIVKTNSNDWWYKILDER